MAPCTVQPSGSLRLRFGQKGTSGDADAPLPTGLSVIQQTGPCLWVASDETASLERLTDQGGGRFAAHRSFSLADYLDLPSGADGEVDIEGLTVDHSWLWLVGSHSLARRKPRLAEPDAAKALSRLTEVRHEPNRFLLARLPLTARDGEDELRPSRQGAGCLKIGRKGNALTKALRHDIHIGRFLGVPAKENGFDIEGLAVRGERAYLGLRGPVLRGWALILELAVTATRHGRLKLRPLGPDGEPYRKHFLDLDGLGIRDLCFIGDGLLILAGPTMDLDGPVRLFVWPGALAATGPSMQPRKKLEALFAVPHGAGCDHAEGMCLFKRSGQPPTLLVVYDNPGAHRLHQRGTAVDADLFTLPGSAPAAGA